MPTYRFKRTNTVEHTIEVCADSYEQAYARASVGCIARVREKEGVEIVGYDEGTEVVDCTDCTDVVFLWEDDGEDVFAVFPGVAGSVCFAGDATCYASVGQHGAADLELCNGFREVTDPDDYADLKRELETIGYVLRIVSKDRMLDAGYRDQRLAEIRSA
ncbi:MAG: hypothetical protein ACYS7Y_31910 [Planctomycetota bacterium]|jgi:hypothetical protein